MTTNEIAIVVIVAAVVGGAWGARIGGAAPWKGAIAVVVAALVPMAVAYAIGYDSAVISTLLAIVSVSVIGGALHLRARQIASVLTGCFLAAIVAGVSASYVA